MAMPRVDALYDATIARAKALGWRRSSTSTTRPFAEIAALLYDGPWLAERLAAVEAFLDTKPEAIDPTVRSMIEGRARQDGRRMRSAASIG